MNQLKKKLGRQTSNVISYAHRMINGGIWKSNERIPTLDTISKTCKVSIPTVRKAIKFLETEKTIQNYGSLGFYLLSDVMVKQHKSNRISLLSHMALTNLNLSEIEQYNRKLFGSYGIKLFDTGCVDAINIITHKRIRTSMAELNEIITAPIMIEPMLHLNDSTSLSKMKLKYKRQQYLKRLARVIHLHKQELNINDHSSRE